MQWGLESAREERGRAGRLASSNATLLSRTDRQRQASQTGRAGQWAMACNPSSTLKPGDQRGPRSRSELQRWVPLRTLLAVSSNLLNAISASQLGRGMLLCHLETNHQYQGAKQLKWQKTQMPRRSSRIPRHSLSPALTLT